MNEHVVIMRDSKGEIFAVKVMAGSAVEAANFAKDKWPKSVFERVYISNGMQVIQKPRYCGECGQEIKAS